MSLVTYQDARPWARSSKQRVAWTDGGAREGNPADFEAKPVAKELYWRGQRDGSGPPDTTVLSPCLRGSTATSSGGFPVSVVMS